ncbi:hypothetical protein [Brevibacterium litoralis]|uniref:hypothetical protein n=1 Tax=Brevibacterium litoralis TaxID=3138935 RepID=UPI0032EEB043
MNDSASPFPGMSPAARSKTKRGFLIWGIVLLSLWLGCSLLLAWFFSSLDGDANLSAPSFGEALLTSGFLGGLFFLLGAVFFIIGLVSEIRARSFDSADRSRAALVTTGIQNLLSRPRTEGYQSGQTTVEVPGAVLLEVYRHFDQDTAGQILTTINTTTRGWGLSSSFLSGSSSHRATGPDTASSSHLGSSIGINTMNTRTTGTEFSTVNQTTRQNLMGDALFSVFEVTDPQTGRTDTVRAVSLSTPAVVDFIRDLVSSACDLVGGPGTHAGASVLHFMNAIIGQFAPGDISYVTDRLKSIHARPLAERRPVVLRGETTGRNAILVTTLQMEGEQPLETYPARLPELLGRSIQTPSGAPALTSSTPQPMLPAPGPGM